MANKKISALTEKTTLDSTDFFVIAETTSDNKKVDKATLVNEIAARAASYTPSGTTETIDLSTGNLQTITTSSASGTVTLTLSNPVDGLSWLFKVIHGATQRDLVFPAGTLQSGGLGTTVTASGANQTDLISVFYDGTNYLVALSSNYA